MRTSLAFLPRRGLLLVAVAAFPLWLVADAGAGPAAPAPEQAAQSSVPAMSAFVFEKDREAIFKAFYATGLDTSKPYAVTNLAIKKDNMTLLLKQGALFLMQPIAGEVTGAAFVGQGEASMTPPNRTERYMLNKYYGAEVLKEPFSEAVFRFSDGTDRTMVAAARPDPAATAQATRVSEIFTDRNARLNGTRSLHLEMQFLENRISGLKGQDFFSAVFHSAKHDWLTYHYNPQDIHENDLSASESMGVRFYMVPWTVWHEQSNYAPSGHYVLVPDRDGPRVIKVLHHEMTLDLHDTKTVEWVSQTRFEPLVDNIRCVRFDLDNNGYPPGDWNDTGFYPVRLLSVADASGNPLPHMHKKDQLLVVLPAAAPAGTALTLSFKGEADVVYQVTAESFGLLQADWYPQYGYRGGRSTFHWTVRVPRPFTVTGSGRIVREFEDKESRQNGIETKSDLPVNFPWLIFGKFWNAKDVYVGEESQKTVGLSMHTVSIGGSGTPTKKVEQFFAESKEILKLFESIYGPFPYEELHIAQMGPGLGFGQGPPYFVQLTGELFLAMSSLGQYSVHDFLSHEISHQWWGNQIGWASDDDDWISEGFASYAAGIFIHALQKQAGFQRMLDEWRKDAKNADKEAPIAAASTLRGPNAGQYRQGLLYNKAPYVLHMLRVQLDDEKYRKVMRSLQETYRHRDISTEMLLREVNKVTGSDFTYFFDQWIWDVGIPTFRYSWRSERQPDGKFLVTVHVSQDDKTRVKKVLMPVHLHFKDKSIPQYKPIVQADQDIKFMVPMDPKNVTLDDDRTLLAEFVKAG